MSNLKKLLLDREWIETSREGLSLKEPEALLLEWAENYDPSRNRPRAYYSLKSSAEIESDIADQCDRAGLRYALTAFSGAARLAPAVRYQRASAFVESADKIASSLDLKEVESGANVSLLTPKGRRQNNCLVLSTLFLFQVVIAMSSGITRAWQAP